MKGLFLDASDALADVFDRMVQPDDPPITVSHDDVVPAEALPSLLDGYDFVLDDHSYLPASALSQCKQLKHVIFLGTGARSYMDPEELAGLGITVHTIKGYGDVAVAEHTVALIWAAARGLAAMDRGMRAGQWLRTEGVQLRGKMLGLLGFGGIAAEVASIMAGAGMRVMAWNRTPRAAQGVEFVELDRLLAESDVLSLHLLLTDETRGFLGTETAGPAAALHDPGEHRTRRAGGRSGADRGSAAPAGSRMRRWTCSTTSRCPPGIAFTDARPGHAVRPQRLPHAGGERHADPPRAGHRQADRGGLEKPSGARLAKW